MLQLSDLEKLHGLWVDRGAQIVSALAPGLEPEDARRLTSEHEPLALSDELALWFSWHNGATDSSARWCHTVGGGIEYVPLESCLESFDESQEEWSDYNPYLLPLFSGVRDLILAECSPGSPQVSAIWVIPWSGEPRVAWPTVGDLVASFIDLIELGAWPFEPGYPGSTTVDRLVPNRILDSGIY